MKITLYGAASHQIDEVYKEEGKKLGKEIAKRNHTLIFGGGGEGMMGSVANECLKEDIEVIGIIPELFRNQNLTFNKVIYTKDMKERKKELRELADGFIISPGGIGTLDEFFEVLELTKHEIESKPIAIFNINNYFTDIVNFIEKNVETGFIPEKILQKYKVTTTVEETLNYLEKSEK